jgi:hypothetical protein
MPTLPALPPAPVDRLRRPKAHHVPDPSLVIDEFDRARNRLGQICRAAERDGARYPGQHDDLLAYLRRLQQTLDRSIERLEAAQSLLDA